MPLTIVADIRAVPGQEAAVEAALTGLIEPTRLELGCVQYDLHRDHEDPAHFLFYETWETKEHWLAHNGSKHIEMHKAASASIVESTTIWQMERIG